jgi:hypothetical protein
MFKKIPYCITGIELGRAATHRQDGSDTIPTRNKSKFKKEAEFLS